MPKDAGDWRHIDELFSTSVSEFATVVVIVDASLGPRIAEIRKRARRAVYVAADDAAERLLQPHRFISVAGVTSAIVRAHLLAAACELACTRVAAVRRRRSMMRIGRTMGELNRVGLGLMFERDERRLLRRITRIGKRLTMSDGATLLLASPENEPTSLSVAHAEFDTIQSFELRPGTLAVDDSSIIGHAAQLKRPTVIRDAYDLPADAGFVIDESFDKQYRYRRRSMLIVPMVDHHEHLVGVLVLVNRKSDRRAMITSKKAADEFVLPYRPRDVRLAGALAGVAAVSIENTRLHRQIARMLEDFVKASVTAIDQRDPSTAGHSLRVARLSLAMARAIGRTTTGDYAARRFNRAEMRELRFAALLHDFGKVAVREDLLIKAKKLPPVLWERVKARFDVIHRTIELEACSTHGREAPPERDGLGELASLRDLVMTANEPTVDDQAAPRRLSEMGARTFPMPDGTVMPYLTTQELHFLQLTHGTLDDAERAQIESHVEETFQFLVKIPWTPDLSRVPEYAYDHHELLNGGGYPRHLANDEIPVQSRIITIADIFDALTAADRPYKSAVPVERALDILQSEADAGLLDRELVRILIESGSYRDLMRDG